jgi:conjugative transfer region protein TrbK
VSALDLPKLARLAALALAAGAVLAAALAIGGRAPDPDAPAPPVSATSLSGDLDRCRALGAAAQDDRSCREAWKTSRERFLGAPEGRP